MAKEIKAMTATEVVAELKNLGLNEKSLTRFSARTIGAPLKGYFNKPKMIKTKINGKDVEFAGLEIVDENGTYVGDVAAGTILQPYIKAGTKPQQISSNSTDYAGKWRMSSPNTFVNDFCVSRSPAEVFSFLIGKGYTAKMKSFTVPKLELDENGKVTSFTETKEEAATMVTEKMCWVCEPE